MLIIQTQPTYRPPGYRICHRERRARPLAEFVDINSRGCLTTETGKPLKKYYNHCLECVDRRYRHSQCLPQIPLAGCRGLTREENEAREARIEERTEVNAARRLQRLQNEPVAEATRQEAARQDAEAASQAVYQADDASAQGRLFNMVLRMPPSLSRLPALLRRFLPRPLPSASARPSAKRQTWMRILPIRQTLLLSPRKPGVSR